MDKTMHKPVVAVILSILLPGLGQFYNHETKKALLLFLCFIVSSYFYSPAGIIIIIIAAIESYRKAKNLKNAGFISENLNLSIYILVAFFIIAILVGFFAGFIFDAIREVPNRP